MQRKRLHKGDWFYLVIIFIVVLYALFPYIRQWSILIKNGKEGITVEQGEETLHIAFLPVGQGDSAIVKLGNWSALIDTGVYASYDVVSQGLDQFEIKKLDAVFISHPHYDHIGCLQSVLQDYKVEHVYFADVPEEFIPASEWYERILDVIDKKDIPLTILYRGDIVNIDGTNASFETLWSGGGEDLNDCSMVLRLTIGKYSALFMGDAEHRVEEELVSTGKEIRSQILKVGHHGTRYATYSHFLNYVRPEYAIISCGIDNEFGYPKEDVLERLSSIGAVVLRTDTQGMIHFVITEDSIQYEVKGIEE
ncbi:MAG: MBL fold metallo-hydrolase [Oscillospiraceae bacterium]|nr:MBL fold metallo-hydrolase [Oscillospiraceae bacterium]